MGRNKSKRLDYPGIVTTIYRKIGLIEKNDSIVDDIGRKVTVEQAVQARLSACSRTIPPGPVSAIHNSGNDEYTDVNIIVPEEPCPENSPRSSH